MNESNNNKRFLIIASLLFLAVSSLRPIAWAEGAKDREKALIDREKQLQAREQELNERMKKLGIDSSDARLPEAKPGQCFAKIVIPQKYESVTEKVKVSEESTKIDVIPSVYKTVEERFVVEDATDKIVEIPAVFDSVEEKILIEPTKRIWLDGRDSNAKEAPATWVSAAKSSGILTGEKEGQCFVEFFQPARYKTEQHEVVKREAGTRIEVVPAQYEWAEERVVVKEASDKIVDIPAVYETVEEKILERAAYTTWKKGRGPIEKIDNSTGEIMCMVEVPATYKTVEKRVLKTPATSKKVTIPAEYETMRVRKLVTTATKKDVPVPAVYEVVNKKVKISDEAITWREDTKGGSGEPTGRAICRGTVPAKYKTVTKQIIKTPATSKVVKVPAKYKTVKVRKLVKPAQRNITTVPAKYETVTKKHIVADAKQAWRPVLCETNTSPKLIEEIQRAVKRAGYDPGTIDGHMGRKTYTAIEAFQKAQGFGTGGITLRTLEALGVSKEKPL